MGVLLKPKPLAKKRMSVREFLALPPDEAFETELVYGEMIVMPKPGADHNDLMVDLGDLLRLWVRFYLLGRICFDIDMILDEDNALVYAPDLLFVATENMHRLRKGRVYGPADLAIEIKSPSDRPSRQMRKYADYERYGIPWYWLIDALGDVPTLAEHQLVNGTYVTRNEIAGDEWFEPGVFPGLVFRLPQLLKSDLKAAVKGKAKKLM